MHAERRRIFAGIALVVMIVLVIIGIIGGTTWLTVAGVVGAIPSLASQFARLGSSGKPSNPEGALVRPMRAKPRGQESAHPDRAALTEALKRRRNPNDT